MSTQIRVAVGDIWDQIRVFSLTRRSGVALAGACFGAVAFLPPVLAQTTVQVGYTVVNASSGTTIPAGSALFSYTNPAGVLVAEAGVGAATAIRSGRIFVDQEGTQTGIAIANASAQNATATLILRDSSGNTVTQQALTLGAGQQTAKNVSELFPNSSANFTGSMSFESDQPLAAITLRQSQNGYGEPLFTTLPVVDESKMAASQPIVFPQVAVGGGFTTQIILINTTEQSLHGRIDFVGSDGQPLWVQASGASVYEIAYQISPQGTYMVEVGGDSDTNAGYAVVTPDAGTVSPAGSAVFRFQSNGQLVTEAGVPVGTATTAARIFVDYLGSQMGVAIANSSSISADVTLTLMDRYGDVGDTATLTLPAGGHVAKFVHELFPEVGDGYGIGYSGVMEIRSASPIVPVTLLLTNNARNDLVLATLPVADLTQPSTAASLIFPQVAVGGGFATQLIFINTNTTNAATGSVAMYQQGGVPFTMPIAGTTASQFPFQLPSGGVQHLYPGNAATAASLTLIDPSSGQVTTEVAINVGNTVRPRLLISDSTGAFRDDFNVTIQSLDTSVASIDSSGAIKGESAGFSTLTMTAQSAFATAAATVVTVNSGASGFQIQGITQDQANRLYLAASAEQAILLAQDLTQAPATYAGVPGSPGFKNGPPLASQFHGPSFLAFDQAQGTLYVSDAANNVIRRVNPGSPGTVDTLAGSGVVGYQDGALNQASFNNPQGIALDNRGYLWVADSGNNTIRRIDLQVGTVTTIAGLPGIPGFSDGEGQAARFQNPIGLAVETETAAEELQREIHGQPPPPVQVLVADSGNNVIRRVSEDGIVETISTLIVAPNLRRRSQPFPRAVAVEPSPILFTKPTAVAIDPLGNVFVNERTTRLVKTILTTGSVVTAAQKNTFTAPGGIAISRQGAVVVADSARSAQQIVYGQPQIANVTPSRIGILGGEQVTVRGSNFAPDTAIVLAGVIVTNFTINNTQTLTFTTPSALPSGLTTLTIQNRGGLAQTSILVEPLPLSSLSAGNITTVAGGSTFAGDGSIATAANLATPAGMAMDSNGNFYIADTTNHRIRRVDALSGVITTIAGTGLNGFSGDNGPAIAAQLSYPWGVAVNSKGDVFISDNQNNRVRKVDASTGIITTVAGTGQPGFSGEGRPAVDAMLSAPFGITVDEQGNLLIADGGNYRIRKLDASTGTIITIAGNGSSGFSGDNGIATGAAFATPYAIALDAAGNLFVADVLNQRIRKIDAQSRIITTIAGSGTADFSGDGGPATSAALYNPWGIAVDRGGNVFIADQQNNRIREIAAGTQIISTVSGTAQAGYSGDGQSATMAQLAAPYALLVDGTGNLLIGDAANHRVRKIAVTNQIITTVVGNGQASYLGDNGQATAADLAFPSALAFNAGSDMFIADTMNHRIRKIDAVNGTIVTIAGTGVPQFSVDGGLAAATSLSFPQGVAVDQKGNVFIADSGSNRIRQIQPGTGIIVTVAGSTAGIAGFAGDNGLATTSMLNSPKGIVVDRAGNLFIADSQNNRIRRVDALTGMITTVAGNGESAYSGDNGPAGAASLNFPTGIAIDVQGNLFIADYNNSVVREVAVETGIITTVAGDGGFHFAGDGGPAVTAGLNLPYGVAFASSGNLYIADRLNSRVRKVDSKTGIITTVAGSGQSGISGDGGPAANAALAQPLAVAIDGSGTLFIADAQGNRIRGVRSPK